MYRRLLYILVFLFWTAGCSGIQRPAPVTNYGQSGGAGSAGVHNVVRGDTLYTVAQNYRLPMRDIAVINHLKAPFKLTEGQRLKLPPPRDYRVRPGDTVYSVSQVFNVNASEIVKVNNLRPPYRLNPGQVIRLPSIIQARAQPKAVPMETVEREVLTDNRPVVNNPNSNIEVTKINPPANPSIPAPSPNTTSLSTGPSDPSVPHPPKLVRKVSDKLPARSSSKFLKPVDGKIISDFGPKKDGLHNDGINIAAKKGTNIHAAENGIVVYAGNELKGSGNLVLIRHADQWMTAYGHLEKMNVRSGEVVKRGQNIGKVGSSGSVIEPQLHFEIRRGTEAINPKNYME